MTKAEYLDVFLSWAKWTLSSRGTVSSRRAIVLLERENNPTFGLEQTLCLLSATPLSSKTGWQTKNRPCFGKPGSVETTDLPELVIKTGVDKGWCIQAVGSAFFFDLLAANLAAKHHNRHTLPYSYLDPLLQPLLISIKNKEKASIINKF